MLLPEVCDASTFAAVDVTRQCLLTLQHRMRSRRYGLGHSMVDRPVGPGSTAQPGNMGVTEHSAAGDNAGAKSRRLQRCGVWLEGFSRFGDVSGVNGFRDFTLVTGGGTLGFDCAFRDRLVAGADPGYAGTEVDLDGNWSSVNIRSMYGSVHGTAFSRRARAEGVLSYGRHRFHVDRAMKIGSIESRADNKAVLPMLSRDW